MNERAKHIPAPVTLRDLLFKMRLNRNNAHNSAHLTDHSGPRYANQASRHDNRNVSDNYGVRSNISLDEERRSRQHEAQYAISNMQNDQSQRRGTTYATDLGVAEKWVAIVLGAITDLINDKKHSNPEESYTALLFASGESEMSRRLIDEAGGFAVAIATSENADSIVNEAADVIYHVMACLSSAGISLEKVADQLALRIKDSGADIPFNHVAREVVVEYEAKAKKAPQLARENYKEQINAEHATVSGRKRQQSASKNKANSVVNSEKSSIKKVVNRKVRPAELKSAAKGTTSARAKISTAASAAAAIRKSNVSEQH